MIAEFISSSKLLLFFVDLLALYVFLMTDEPSAKFLLLHCTAIIVTYLQICDSFRTYMTHFQISKRLIVPASRTTEELLGQGRYKDTQGTFNEKWNAVTLKASKEKWNARVITWGTHESFNFIENKNCEIFFNQVGNDKTLSIREQMLSKRQDNRNDIFIVKNNIANVYVDNLEYKSALLIYNKIIGYWIKALDSKDPFTLSAKGNLAEGLCGKHNEALLVFKDVFRCRAKCLGIKVTDTIPSSRDITMVLLKQENCKEAFKLFVKACANVKVKTFQNWNILFKCCNIADVLKYQHKFNRTTKLHTVVYQIQKRLNSMHPETLRTSQIIAERQAKYNAAFKAHRKIYNIHREYFYRPDSFETEKNTARKLYEQGEYSKALNLLTCMLQKYSLLLGIEDKRTLEIQNSMALLFCEQGEFEEALKIYTTVYEIQSNLHGVGPDHLDTLYTKSCMGTVCLYLHRYCEALKFSKEVLKKMQVILGHDHKHCIAVQINIATIYVHQNKYMEAAEKYYEIYKTLEKTLGLMHPYTLQVEKDLHMVLNMTPKCSN